MITETQKQDIAQDIARMIKTAASKVSADKLEALYKHDIEAIFRLFDTQIKTFLSSEEFQEDIAYSMISAAATDAIGGIVDSLFDFDAILSKYGEIYKYADCSPLLEASKHLDLKLQKAVLIDSDAEFLTIFAKELQARFPDQCPPNLKPVFGEPYTIFTFADGSSSPLINSWSSGFYEYE